MGIIGTNGSGKSTILKIVTRVPYPYHREVKVDGQDIGSLELVPDSTWIIQGLKIYI